MTDHFALLNQPRRPWLDPDSLKQKFLALAADRHPDRVHGADASEKAEATRYYARLNAAFHCLAEPKSRLLHLLELEIGARPKDIEQIPVALAGLFAEVASECGKADQFLAKKSRATSPLLQVQFFERGQEWLERLNTLKCKLDESRGKLEADLKSLDAKWGTEDETVRKECLPGLEELYRLFSYFNRWNNQIQERLVRLSA